MSPNEIGEPTGAVAEAIKAAFGSFDAFKDAFSNAAATQFEAGLGTWLCAKEGQVSVCATPNQDNPLMAGQCGGTPILAIDVWEHAYLPELPKQKTGLHQCFSLM